MKKFTIVFLYVATFVVGVLAGGFVASHWWRDTLRATSIASAALGQELLQKNDYGKAIEMFGKSLANNPTWYVPYLGLAQSYEKLGLSELAIEEYKIAAKLTDLNNKSEKLDTVILYVSIGDLYLRRGNVKQAIEYYMYASGLEAAWPDAYKGLGFSYYKLGQIKEARSNFQKYLQLEFRESQADQKKTVNDFLKRMES